MGNLTNGNKLKAHERSFGNPRLDRSAVVKPVDVCWSAPTRCEYSRLEPRGTLNRAMSREVATGQVRTGMTIKTSGAATEVSK